MSTFAVLTRNGGATWTPEHLDLNVWVLPAFVRRQVYVVDVGICATLTEPAGDKPFECELVLPFTPDESKLTDLVPRMRGDAGTCSLVFGKSDIQLSSVDSTITDDDGILRLTALDLDKCKRLKTEDDRPQTRWAVSSGSEVLPAATRVYLRLRFVTHDSGRVWAWQKSGRWNSHAISDIRVNEFREQRSLENRVDMGKVVSFPRVNGFLIASANYKAGRLSPQPKYVRILENRVWEPYLGRRLGGKNELFIITYWKDAAGVSAMHPFRAFMEVERRRPTALKSVTIGTAVTVAALVVLQPLNWLSQSIASQAVAWIWQIVLGSLTIGAVYAAGRVVIGQLSKGNLQRLRSMLRWLEAKWYRPSR